MPSVLPGISVGLAFAYVGIVCTATITRVGLDVLYAYHPIGACGFLLFATCGLITGQRPHTERGNYKQLISNHGNFQLAATLCAIACGITIVINKELHGKAHWKSWHGIIGTVTIVLWILQQLGGALAWYYPKKVAPGGGAELKRVYRLHAFGGYALFIIMLAVHGLALAGGYQGFKVYTSGWFSLAFMLAFLGCLMLLGSRPINNFFSAADKRA